MLGCEKQFPGAQSHEPILPFIKTAATSSAVRRLVPKSNMDTPNALVALTIAFSETSVRLFNNQESSHAINMEKMGKQSAYILPHL
jgi:hypothetical protein